MNCRSCNNKITESILDLGKQPWCGDFDNGANAKRYPLCLVYCSNCELLQLSHTVPKEIMFLNHDYLSGTTKTLVEHFRILAIQNKQQFDLKEQDQILDIGGNDGTQMLQYKNIGLPNVFNVESAKNIAEISKNNGIWTIPEFFNEETAMKHFLPNSIKLINASGVFFHLEELHSVIRGINYVLRDDGVFVVQFMYAGSMIDNGNFDTIYHEHLCYYTLRSLCNLLEPYGLSLWDAEFCDIHSGSIVAKFLKKTNPLSKEKTPRCDVLLERDKKYTLEKIKKFAKNVESFREIYLSLLKGLECSLWSESEEKKTIYAYGAPAKGNTFLNYIDNGELRFIINKCVEINELKIGKHLPGTGISITREDPDDIPDYYLLLSHNFADEILAKRPPNAKFIIPFPELKIV